MFCQQTQCHLIVALLKKVPNCVLLKLGDITPVCILFGPLYYVHFGSMPCLYTPPHITCHLLVCVHGTAFYMYICIVVRKLDPFPHVGIA